MDARFRPHNLHRDSPREFEAYDPHLRALAEQPLRHRSPLLDRLPREKPGIYSVTGGRQVGKTTVLKQWMAELVRAGVGGSRIAYLTGELVDDHHALVRLFEDLLVGGPAGIRYVLLDEVTYVRDWDRGVKYLADSGLLKDVVLVLTGSDSVVIQEARLRLPGRRGRSDVADFHLYPLSFADHVRLVRALPVPRIDELAEAESEATGPEVEALLAAFESYLVHGGYLTAINDVAREGRIARATLATYSDWIRGDVIRRGRSERSLREVLASAVKRQGAQVTWNALARELSIDHPATVADYVELLARMDVLFVQPALREDALAGAPKKARKLGFRDPFIEHAVRSWLWPVRDPFEEQIRPALADPESAGRLAEACAASHAARRHPTYYIKAAGEVDLAWVEGRRFFPVEVKWTGQIRPRDLAQVARYRNGLVCTRRTEPGEVAGVRTLPLPLFLLRLGPSPTAPPAG